MLHVANCMEAWCKLLQQLAASLQISCCTTSDVHRCTLMKSTGLIQLVANLHQAGKIHNLHQVCGVWAVVPRGWLRAQRKHAVFGVGSCTIGAIPITGLLSLQHGCIQSERFKAENDKKKYIYPKSFSLSYSAHRKLFLPQQDEPIKIQIIFHDKMVRASYRFR